MAIEVLAGLPHERKHDLESFYWLLIWIVLRHTNHSLDVSACTALFDRPSVALALEGKRIWIEYGPSFSVHENEPLSTLLNNLRLAFLRQQEHPFYDSIEVVYEKVIELMNTALDLPGWPENDSSIPFVLTSQTQDAIAVIEHNVRESASRKLAALQASQLTAIVEEEVAQSSHTSASSKRLRQDEDIIEEVPCNKRSRSSAPKQK